MSVRHCVILLCLATPAPANAKPLRFNYVFNHPLPILCEFTAYRPNKLWPKGQIFLTACDFKADWAKKNK